VSGASPATTIFEVFGKVDKIADALESLSSQSQSYALFTASLQQLLQQLIANQGVMQAQLAALQNSNQAILALIQSVIAGMATAAGQRQALQILQQILAAIVTGVPASIDIDTSVRETTPQPRPTRAGP
jgi:hypothetical protein